MNQFKDCPGFQELNVKSSKRETIVKRMPHEVSEIFFVKEGVEISYFLEHIFKVLTEFKFLLTRI